jgi:hypothetical protein
MKTLLLFRSVLCLVLLMPVCACNSTPPAAENLAPNSSFEQGQEDNVSGWEGNHAGVNFTWNEDIARNGTHSICISDLPAQRSADWNTSEPIPVTPGETYILRAYARGDFDREAYILVFPLNADGDTLEGFSAPLASNDTNWRSADVTLTVPPEAVAVELDLGVNNDSDSASTGLVCFDDISFSLR